MNQVLIKADLEFTKILLPRLHQNSSNTNPECARKSKQLYSLCDQLLGALIHYFFYPDSNLFLIDYACCKTM